MAPVVWQGQRSAYTSSLCCLADYSPNATPWNNKHWLCHSSLLSSDVAYLGILLKLSPAIRLGCLIQSFTGEGPTFRSSRWSKRLRSSQARGFSSSLAVAQKPLRSLPPSLHRAAPNVAAASPEGEWGGTQLIFYSSEASHLSQPHQWEGVKWGISASRAEPLAASWEDVIAEEAKILSCHINQFNHARITLWGQYGLDPNRIKMGQERKTAFHEWDSLTHYLSKQSQPSPATMIHHDQVGFPPWTQGWLTEN